MGGVLTRLCVCSCLGIATLTLPLFYEYSRNEYNRIITPASFCLEDARAMVDQPRRANMSTLLFWHVQLLISKYSFETCVTSYSTRTSTLVRTNTYYSKSVRFFLSGLLGLFGKLPTFRYDSASPPIPAALMKERGIACHHPLLLPCLD